MDESCTGQGLLLRSTRKGADERVGGQASMPQPPKAKDAPMATALDVVLTNGNVRVIANCMKLVVPTMYRDGSCRSISRPMTSELTASQMPMGIVKASATSMAPPPFSLSTGIK